MQIALIPPLSWLTYVSLTRYQLMLPFLLKDNNYMQVYGDLCRDSKQYVILDNGAAEKQFTDPSELLTTIAQMRPSEVVAPDVLSEGAETVMTTTAFMKMLKDSSSFGRVNVAVVAQGKNRDQALNTVQQLLEEFNDDIHAIHIPRLLVDTMSVNGFIARIKLAQDIRQITDKEIHFLGASPYWVLETKEAAQLGFVRGIDTSMPFNYAYHSKYIDGPEEIGRPADYFYAPSSYFDTLCLSGNVHTMHRWANGLER
jgi:hypothetical protein